MRYYNLLLIGFFCLSIFGCNSKKQTTKEFEEENPTSFLGVETTMFENKILTRRPSLFNHSEYKTDGYIISGHLTSRTTIVAYKNIELEISFYTEAGTTIREQKEVLYETIGPNSSREFKIHVYPPITTPYANVSVISATPIK